MPRLLHLHKPHRLFAALVVFCYFFVSAVIPFQHNHAGEEAQVLLCLSGSSMSARTTLPVHTQVTRAASQAVHPSHCAACEWQAANVSPALPAFVFTFVSPAAPRVVTNFPRYLRILTLSASSRAPPLV